MRFVGRDKVWAWAAIAIVVAGQTGSAAAERHPSGRDIYRQQCARCHGRNGEGVKGKHEEPLQGDRSLEKLTRYIDRNMPDDDPGKCVGADAAAVAHYIYDAFYSREARLRNHPPRVELLRLTNRQYLNTVADLLKHFSQTPSRPPEERSGERRSGLQATYYNSRNFNDEKKAFERVDRQVDFDFSEGDDHDKLSGTNGFSIQWRGSLIADETGDYEFILKTPNGARLWVNDDAEPLIDGWVASGQAGEQKATLRLIGGRAYPLRLNFFKFKEKTAAISMQWKPPHGAQQLIPARNLSPSATSPTLVISTPFPPDDSSLGYERGMSVSKAWDDAATTAAIEVASYVVKNLNHLSHSKPDDTNRTAKIQTFCKEFVATAWRRLLTEQQTRLLVSAQFNKGTKTEDAVKRVVLLALKSPRFLYLGLESGKPDDFEVASRLSFGLCDSLPDQELGQLAAQGKLRTREQVEPQARRMLGDPRAHAKMQSFFHHWLQMDRVENLSKDDKLFPGFTPAIIADLRTSLNLFLDDAMWDRGEGTSTESVGAGSLPLPQGAGRGEGEQDARSESRVPSALAPKVRNSDYRTLLLADYLFLNNRLAEFYGMETNATDDFVKVKLNPDQRSGVLTHPYLLAAFSYQKMTSPIHRGVFLTRNIVGRGLRPPPMAMTFKDADFAPNLTMREKVSQLTSPQACQACHSVINPLGFSLEQYDAVGRFRTSDHDQPINPVSDYATDDGQTVHLAGARDVANFAISSEQAQNAFIEQLFHHLIKQPALAYGPETINSLRAAFVASDFNMQNLIVDIVTLAALHGAPKTTANTAESAHLVP